MNKSVLIQEQNLSQDQQSSSLPSSRRQSTNFSPSQLALVNGIYHPTRVFIRIPVKDVGVQVDLIKEDQRFFSSNVSCNNLQDIGTSTDHQPSLAQLSLKDQQYLFQQALQYVLLGIQQNMGFLGSQLSMQQKSLFHSHPSLVSHSLNDLYTNPAIYNRNANVPSSISNQNQTANSAHSCQDYPSNSMMFSANSRSHLSSDILNGSKIDSTGFEFDSLVKRLSNL